MLCRTLIAVSVLVASTAQADLRELVDPLALKSIAAETSGEEAKRNLDTITVHHRMRASDQFDAATAHILGRLEHYGIDDVERIEFAADGETLFGTQKSRPKWEVEFAELWELGDDNGRHRA